MTRLDVEYLEDLEEAGLDVKMIEPDILLDKGPWGAYQSEKIQKAVKKYRHMLYGFTAGVTVMVLLDLIAVFIMRM